MAAVVDCMEAIADLWAGLVPPDRSRQPYHHVDQRETYDDRGFRFELPVRNVSAAIAADRSAALVEWTIGAAFVVTRRGRGFFDFSRSVANESKQLAQAVENKTAWPAKVSEVFVESLETTEEPEGAIVNFNFTVLCED